MSADKLWNCERDGHLYVFGRVDCIECGYKGISITSLCSPDAWHEARSFIPNKGRSFYAMQPAKKEPRQS